ncbi:40S ribosomal protein S7 [Syncephalastrum racemosum]|uniref:40S ribosomal protein S7 n=1 Tax=Syncephalastrum racemosum TaxID=13706 RepID=A0A1X2HPJ0_SYNRA|nr:40S ribosomal protein S7 [Syncephalastrum racemosum]
MASHKITKLAGAKRTDEFELNIAQALVDLENNIPELKKELRPLNFTAAQEVDIGAGKKAIVIFVPVPQLKAYRKVQQRLTRELEKKFSDRHVVIVAQRRILTKPNRREVLKQPRPVSRTLKAVHDAVLEDLVYPSELVGKRMRVKVDGSRTIRAFLDTKEATALEYKLDTFSAVYKKLTGKTVAFEFPAYNDELL